MHWPGLLVAVQLPALLFQPSELLASVWTCSLTSAFSVLVPGEKNRKQCCEWVSLICMMFCGVLVANHYSENHLHQKLLFSHI